MKLDVLGTEYELIETTPDIEPRLKDNCGFMDYTSKKIIIDRTITVPKDDSSMDNLEWLKMKIIRHEIIHAFFFESGLSDYGEDETLCDWLAFQIPKIVTALEQSNSITKHIFAKITFDREELYSCAVEAIKDLGYECLDTKEDERHAGSQV